MGKLLNNYFYGKAGKADYTPDDLPRTRIQLFWEMLRVRFSSLFKLNLLYMLIWLPLLVVLTFSTLNILQVVAYTDDAKAGITEEIQMTETETTTVTYYSVEEASALMYSTLFFTLLVMIPCIAITGPFTAGACYVTRNWSRDEHSFMMSDFKDAMKANWKQSLVISTITGIMPFVVFMCWRFYGEVSASNVLAIVPQVLILMVGLLWMLAVTYMHPMIVCYELKLRDVLRNSFLLAVARLPMSVGIRLLLALPVLLCVGIVYFFGGSYVLVLVPVMYYLLLGYGLSRFITASYTNGVFDRYISSRIEGAVVNRGMAQDDDEDEDEDEDEGNA